MKSKLWYHTSESMISVTYDIIDLWYHNLWYHRSMISYPISYAKSYLISCLISYMITSMISPMISQSIPTYQTNLQANDFNVSIPDCAGELSLAEARSGTCQRRRAEICWLRSSSLGCVPYARPAVTNVSRGKVGDDAWSPPRSGEMSPAPLLRFLKWNSPPAWNHKSFCELVLAIFEYLGGRKQFTKQWG